MGKHTIRLLRGACRYEFKLFKYVKQIILYNVVDRMNAMNKMLYNLFTEDMVTYCATIVIFKSTLEI